MKNIIMYFHGGSTNHGCEAIVRATCKILKTQGPLYSSALHEDYAYELEKITNIKDDLPIKIKKGSLIYYFAAIMHKLRKDDFYYTCIQHKDFFNNIKKGDVYLSIGGDNYCYKGRDILGHYNKRIKQLGGKSVLWGCSVEPDDITKDVAKDLSLYDLIITRENISYTALKAVNPNTILLPDPAFQLDKEEIALPQGFKEGHTVGLNLSPLVTEYGNKDMIINNYRELIRYIIENTEEQILLLPHVVKPNNDDRTILNQLYNEFKDSKRVILQDDCNCMQLKYVISKCRMFIGARTHATIAAYSMLVPTLVAGYSVKAIGIAQELFGTDKNYVIPVQKFQNNDDLVNAFKWLCDNENQIKSHLINFMPEYKNRILKAVDLINNL